MKQSGSKLFVFCCLLFIACSSPNKNKFVVPAEFEKQEYIWLSWIETGFLGGDPFYHTILNATKEITPYVKVRIFYGPQLSFSKAEMQSRIYEKLTEHKIDTSRIELFYSEKSYGAIQDPGPVFLRNENGQLAVADFKFNHPDKRAEAIDRNVAATFHLPIIASDIISEGGAWQTNGKGTLLLVESVELDRNSKMTKTQIEEEYRRVLGISKVIWLPNGPKEEEWGQFENGIYGIGTGGHIDEFCRFADANTILLAEVSEAESLENDISKETHIRMEANFKILSEAKDQDGKSFKIIRIPLGKLTSKKVLYADLNSEEKSWFENVTKDSVEFYLATGYLNLVIANEVVVTSGYWKEGLSEELKLRDAEARAALEKAFPNRKIVQIDCMSLHHDGAGLHCHSRNQPATK